MPRPSRYIAGAKYGRLTLLEREGKSHVRCMCECGTEKSYWLGHVIHGKTQSCGCLHREISSVVLTARQTTHGKFGSKIYSIWTGMLQRCKNPKHQAFESYGGRGITVCKRWERFENFYTDMGDVPIGLTLERVKNHLGYSPKNCVWATRKVQNNNRRACVTLTFQGKTQNITQWAEELGLDRMMLYDRIHAGWSVERTLTTPKRGTPK